MSLFSAIGHRISGGSCSDTAGDTVELVDAAEDDGGEVYVRQRGRRRV